MTNAFSGTSAGGAVLLAGGRRLPAAVADGPAGSPVRVLVRPDRLRLRADADGAALAGTVLTHSFLGPVTRITVRLDGADQLVRVDVASAQAAAHPVAQRVGLDVEPSAAMLAAP